MCKMAEKTGRNRGRLRHGITHSLLFSGRSRWQELVVNMTIFNKRPNMRGYLINNTAHVLSTAITDQLLFQINISITQCDHLPKYRHTFIKINVNLDLIRNSTNLITYMAISTQKGRCLSTFLSVLANLQIATKATLFQKKKNEEPKICRKSVFYAEEVAGNKQCQAIS